MRLPALILVLILGACAAPSYRDRDVAMSSAAAFDPERYTGTWYEIARFPVVFQEGCVAVTAQYELLKSGALGVLNSCRLDRVDGPLRTVRGRAVTDGPGRFKVSFSTVPFVRAPYWVLWVDEDYRTAVVGVPSGRAGWLLHRSPQIPPDRYAVAMEVFDFNGYDTTRIVRTLHD